MNLNTEEYFSTIPKADIPRSIFDRSFNSKLTMNVNYLTPIFIDEYLPGDTLKLRFSYFGRLLNPLVCPVMDDLYFETLWFKCDDRLLWINWEKMCGAQDSPGDSTDYMVPVINSGDGFANGSLADYFGIPTKVANLDVNALPFRLYNKVYNEWFRASEITASLTLPTGDSDSASNYELKKSMKMHDYFTSALPKAQASDPVALPLGISAGVYGDGNALLFQKYGDSADNKVPYNLSGIPFVTNPVGPVYQNGLATAYKNGATNELSIGTPIPSDYSGLGNSDYPLGLATKKGAGNLSTGIYADLSNATAANINDIRFAFQLQKYKERSMRSGNRYVEYLLGHYNTRNGDASMQRSQFLGATRERVNINSVIQTGGSSTPNGTITAYALVGNNSFGFNTSCGDHGLIMGIARIRHNPIYQQGLNKLWSRRVCLDYYDPLFACIGEQPIKNKEIVCQGASVTDESGVIVDEKGYGFQEAWAEYRYRPNEVHGALRSNDSTSLDVYHFGQYFYDDVNHKQVVPNLNTDFLEENIPIERSIAVQDEVQFVFDFQFDYKCARSMPVHSVPGLVDHF